MQVNYEGGDLQSYWHELLTSMFNAVLLILYDVHLFPAFSPMLASPLETFTMVFFWPCSSSGRYTCERSIGPTTFTCIVRISTSTSVFDDRSFPSF